MKIRFTEQEIKDGILSDGFELQIEVMKEKPDIALLFEAVRKYHYQTKSGSGTEFRKDLEALGIADMFYWGEERKEKIEDIREL